MRRLHAGARLTGAQRDSVVAEIEKLAAAGGPTGQRVFLGSRDRTASLQLRDTAGRIRVRLFVDAQDRSRLEFLDAQGNVVSAFPN